MKLLKDHYSEFVLTSDQSDAVSLIQDFLDNDEKIFLLKGYAGSGKTTLLLGLVRYLKDISRPFQLMAPTGRAAKIIRDKTGEEATTIHKGIFSFEDLVEFTDEEKEKGKNTGSTFLYYFKLKQDVEVTNRIIIVDEASMVNNHLSQGEFFRFGSGFLMNDLIEFSRIKTPDLNTKIIFVGDPAQLPPVGMNFSPALSEIYLQDHFNFNPKSIELKEVKRQSANNGILQTASKIRKSLTSGFFNDFNVSGNGRDLFELNYESLMDTYFNLESPKQIIAYKNKTATELNKRIRYIKHSGNVIIQPGDLVISGSNNYKADILNGEFAIVSEVTPQTVNREVIFRRKGGEVVTVNLSWRYVKLIGEDKRLIEGYLLNNFIESDEPYPHPDEMRALYVDFKNRNSGLKPNTPEFKMAIKTDLYFNCMLLKYGYAVTCHKAQGGEWERTIVIWDKGKGDLADGGDLGHKHKSNQDFYRWAYTAVTRASKQMYSVDPPHFNSYSQLNFIDPAVDEAFQELTGTSLQTIEIVLDSNLEEQMKQFGLMDAPIELQNHFIQTRFTLQEKGISLTGWQRKGYEIWYSFQRQSETCALKFGVNGKNEFKDSHAYIPSGTNSEALLSEINSLLKVPSAVNIIRNTSSTVLTRLEFEFEIEEKYPFLKNIFDDLHIKFQPNRISIDSINHLDYKDRYLISRDGETLTFDVEYNKNGFFGRVVLLPRKKYPKSLVNDLKSVILNLKQHGI